MPESVAGWPIRRGDLTLVVKDQVLRVDGTALLESTPVHIGLEQQLATGARRVDVRGRIDADQRAALGFDLRPWLDGPVDVKAAVAQRRDGTGTVDVDADLKTAVLAIDALDCDEGAWYARQRLGARRAPGREGRRDRAVHAERRRCRRPRARHATRRRLADHRPRRHVAVRTEARQKSGSDARRTSARRSRTSVHAALE